MGQKDVEKVQRHEVASENNSIRLEDKKEIKESLATATMLEKKDNAGNDKCVVDDGLKDGFTIVDNLLVLPDETKNLETSTSITKKGNHYLQKETITVVM